MATNTFFPYLIEFKIAFAVAITAISGAFIVPLFLIIFSIAHSFLVKWFMWIWSEAFLIFISLCCSSRQIQFSLSLNSHKLFLWKFADFGRLSTIHRIHCKFKKWEFFIFIFATTKNAIYPRSFGFVLCDFDSTSLTKTKQTPGFRKHILRV